MRVTQPTPEVDPQVADSASPANILLVDDRPQDLAALASILAHPDYRLVTAASGKEALRRILEMDFAVILLDVRMPGMDGFEVASVIKNRDRSRHLPILFLTAAHEDVSTIYRAYSVGAVDYLAKPLDEAVVRAKVGIFVELYRKDLRIQEQARALQRASERERELQLAEVRILSEKRYRSLVEMIPAAVWTATADGVVNYCNHRWYEVTGLRLEEAQAEEPWSHGHGQGHGQGQGQGWLDAVHPDDAVRVAEEWSAAMSQGKTYAGELRLRSSDGSWRWHLCHIVPESESRGGRERVRGWLGMFADCEELKRAAEARDEFMSIASHELRTPLSTLLLNLEALRRQLPSSELDNRAHRKLESALRQTHRMEKLVNNLLDVARIAAGRLELVSEESDLATIVQQGVSRLQIQATGTGCALSFRGPGPYQLMGRWDRVRIEQVVTNLLANAIKYGAGQPIEVSLEQAWDRAGQSGQAVLRVRDQGIGIAPEHRERIFDRFERAVSSKNYSGLGVGLYISRQIVEAHGGTISVVSEPGQGSTFEVVLPLREAQVQVG